MKLLTHAELVSQMQPGEVEVWRDTDDSPYTPEQIDAGIARYNAAPAKEAPVVIDHDNPPTDPRTGPQFGRLESLRRIGAHTIAKLADMDERLKDWARTNLRGRSMEWYEDHGGTAGDLFPRALAFIGAQPPAIKGMAPAQFSEDGNGTTRRKVGSQLANDPVVRLAVEEDDKMHEKKPEPNPTPPPTPPVPDPKVAQFSEAQLAVVKHAVEAAVKPLTDRLAQLETRQTDEATSRFEKRIAQFREQLVSRGIVEPAKVDGEVSFARSLRGSAVTSGDKTVDAAEAYIEKRLADKPTIALGEADLSRGRIGTFSEGKVKTDDGREVAVLIPHDATPEQKAEVEKIARYARQHSVTFGEAQIAVEREAAGV